MSLPCQGENPIPKRPAKPKQGPVSPPRYGISRVNVILSILERVSSFCPFFEISRFEVGSG